MSLRPLFCYHYTMQTHRILAIDPGYERLGIAVIEKEQNERETLVYSDCFKTSAKLAFTERLKLLGEEIERLIDQHKPSALAIEKLFFNSNQKTAMQVSEVRGALLFIALSRGLAIYEYTPLEIKVAVTGDGKSDKGRVTVMIPKLIRLEKQIRHDDEYDAIAIGLTCFAHKKLEN